MTPAEPRQAATVLLLRDGAPGLEVYVLRRTKGMPFAGGMTAYPGGGVDSRDGDTEVAWAGPSPAQWAMAFGCDDRTAR
ncbi:MAG: NUDIX hydrolase, partial [Blastococcus sp.]